MIWVGSFKSLQSRPPELRSADAPLEVHTWVHSEIGLISPLVEWLMSLIVASRCVPGEEGFVELALREALSNAMLHGNRLDPRKVPDPLAFENLRAEHGRGIHLMKLAMDEISYQRGGTEVHMRKKLGLERRTCVSALRSETPCDNPHCRQPES